MKILVIVPYVPSRIRTRPFHLIKALAAQGHRITLATVWSSPQDLRDIDDLPRCLDRVLSERVRLSRSIWNVVRGVPGFRPMQASYSWSPRLARRTTQLLETTDFDVVHVEHLRGVRYGIALLPGLRKRGRRRPAMIWDSVDCISTLFRKTARGGCTLRSRLVAKMELPRTQKYEAWLAHQFDRVFATSEIDRRELLALASNREQNKALTERVMVVPNGVDLQYFAPSTEARAPLTLVMTGKMSYHANVAAVMYLAQELMPQIWHTHPLTRLWVVGKDPSPEVRRLNRADGRIQITGTVEDIRPFLHQATVAVAPVQYGAGIQNKVLESLACGTPVVATPEAVSGLRVRWGEDLIVAPDGVEFAASVSRLLVDPDRRAQLSCAGRRFVEGNHDWHAIAEQLSRTYHDAIA